MAVPNNFASQTGPIPLAELDTNFATPITIGTTSIALGATATSLSGVTLQSPNLVTPALGTPSTGNLSTCTGLPLGTGVTGTLPIGNGGTGTTTPALVQGTNVTITGTWPNQTINSSAGGGGMVYPAAGIANSTGTTWGTSYSTTGSGTVIALANSPALVTPALGTPSALVGTNITGTATAFTASNVTTNANLTGAITSVGNVSSLGSFTSLQLATAVTGETGTGSLVFATSPALVTPALGTPTALVGTNITGTATAFTASNVTTNANLIGAITSVGNTTSLGTFTSLQLATAVTGETGTGALVFATSPTLVTPILGTPTSGTLTNCTFPTLNQNTSGTAANVTGTVAVANGGTGTTTPALVQGTNVTITGTWPNQTINSSAGGGGMVYPAAGIANSTGTTWGTSYSTAGSGTVIALATSPTLVTPVLGTPTSGNLANCTFPTLNQSTTGNAATASAVPYTGLTGTVPTWNQNTSGTAAGLSTTLVVGSGGTGVTTSTGTGANVLNTTPTFITPILGTPTSGTLTNCTFPTLNQNTSGTAAGLSAALNSTGVNYTSAGTGAVTRTAASKFDDTVSVKDFGATGNGVTNDTTAIQAALNSGATGVFIPTGTYKITAALTIPANVRFYGNSRSGCVISCATTNVGILTDAGNTSVSVECLSLTYSVTAVSGANALSLTGFYSSATNFSISNAYIGISSVGTSVTFCNSIGYDNFQVSNCISVGMKLQYAYNVNVSNFYITAGSNTAYGTLLVIDHGQGHNFLMGEIYNAVFSATITNIQFCKFDQIYFDSAAQGGYINSSTSLSFNNCWFSAGRTGGGYPGLTIGIFATIDTSDTIVFTNTSFINCGSDGVLVYGGVSRACFANCIVGGNSVTSGANVKHGIEFDANVSNFSVIGCQISNTVIPGGATQKYGIFINGGTSTNYIITDNQLTGNGTGSLSDNGITANKYISGNTGYITNNNSTASIATTTSSIVVTHNLSATPTVANIQVTPTSSLAASGVNSFWVSTPTSTTFTINVNANVTTTAMTFAWSARVSGA